jgi:hypothetical protein
MRIVMPYGRWTCADGTEFLFNRDYRPLWKKRPDGLVVAADPDEQVNFLKQEFFFEDHTFPLDNPKTYQICTNLLRDWGVEQQVPEMFILFRRAVAAGDLTLLEKRSFFRE